MVMVVRFAVSLSPSVGSCAEVSIKFMFNKPDSFLLAKGAIIKPFLSQVHLAPSLVPCYVRSKEPDH